MNLTLEILVFALGYGEPRWLNAENGARIANRGFFGQLPIANG
jgi:hypothetical protein